MSFGTRIFVLSSLAVLALIVFTYFIRPAAFEPTRWPEAQAKLDRPFVAPPQQKPATPAIKEGAAGSASPLAAQAAPAQEVHKEACDSCRARICTDYKGSGVNLVDGCFAQVNTSQGADATDPTFLADCQAVVACAQEHRCALRGDGATGCYCGSAEINDCIENGPAADAPCLEQWQRAARSRDHHEISLRFSDLKYPSGWANFLIECDVEDCKDRCTS
jgi:hypothetical protein